jgi:MFS family permease
VQRVYLSERPRTGYADRGGRVGRTVVLLGVVSLLTDVSSEATSAVLPLYLTAGLGLSPLAYGFIDGLYQGASSIVRFFGGWLSDRLDRPKPVAVVGYGLSAVARLALVAVQGFAGIAAVLTADRLGKGLRTAPRDALIAASSDPAALGRAYGVHRALDTAGAALGPLLAFAVLLVLPGDYRAVFVASCAAAVLGLAVLVLLVPDLRPARPEPGADPVPRPSLRLLTAPAFRRLVAAAGLLGLLTISDGFLYLALQDRDDLAARWFPLLFVGTNVAYLALAIPFGRVADRFGRARVLVAGHVLLVGAYLCAAGPVSGVGATIACLLLLGAFYAATDGVLAAATAQLVPAGLRGSAIATTQSVVALSRLLAALGFGWLWFGLGRETAVYVVAAALALVVPIAWVLVRGVAPGRQAVR